MFGFSWNWKCPPCAFILSCHGFWGSHCMPPFSGAESAKHVFKCARHVSPLLEHQWSVMNRMESSRSICLLHDAKMLQRLLSTRPLAPPTQGGCSREKSSPHRWHAASNALVGAMEGLGHSKMETSDLSNHNRESLQIRSCFQIVHGEQCLLPRLISNLRPKFLNEKCLQSGKTDEKVDMGA